MNKLPHRQELMLPLLQALADLGGSGSLEEMRNKVVANLNIPDALTVLPHMGVRGRADGRTELEYSLAWARTDLRQLGYLENSARGIWALTPKGREATESGKLMTGSETDGRLAMHDSDWRVRLNQLLLQKLTPAAFERLIQRVLRESGFSQVEVTGRVGDGGIDGKGIAKINGMLSFRVVFQCKRYNGSVSAGEIRDFRGAMQGRADKGLLITTGTFTREALREATRDGATAIDLMDGPLLIEKLRELSLGIRVETIERVLVEPEWFDSL